MFVKYLGFGHGLMTESVLKRSGLPTETSYVIKIAGPLKIIKNCSCSLSIIVYCSFDSLESFPLKLITRNLSFVT